MSGLTEYNYREHNMSRFGVMTEHPIIDTQGRPFTVKLFRYPTPSVYKRDAFENRENHFENDPRLASYAEQVFEALRLAFRDTDSEAKATKSRFGFVSTDDSLDLVLGKTPAGQEIVVAAHSYKTGVLPDYDLTPFLYTHYAGVHPDYQRGNIRSIAEMTMLNFFRPGVFCATTRSDAIIAGVVKMAAEMGYKLYPKANEDTPEEVYKLGRAVLSASLSPEAELGRDLVRTGNSPYTEDVTGRPPHPILKRLNLTTYQAGLYVAISPRLFKVIDKS